MRWESPSGSTTRQLGTTTEDAFQLALQSLRDLLENLPDFPALRAVSHRVVHGGAAFADSVWATESVLQQLEKLNSLARLHQPHNIAGIRAFMRAFPGVPQVACFDTAFHASAPALHQAFALPSAIPHITSRRPRM